MVTVAPHLEKAIGVQLVSADEGPESTAIFKPLLSPETALPARRTAQYTAPKDGGDVLIRVCEGTREIKVVKAEAKPKAEPKAEEEADSDIDSDEDSEEEEEDTRHVVWNISKSLAEIAVKGVKAGGKVEVMVSVNEHLVMQITAREVGGKGGVRVVVDSSQNGVSA